MLLLIALSGAFAFAVYSLRIEQVRVVGLKNLPAKAVIDASGLEPGERILWVRLSAAERGVEKIPAVADAVAERSLPSTVVIHVRERVPLARLDGARKFVVDEEGYIFSPGPERVEPVLYGWKGKPKEGKRVDDRSRSVLKAIATFPELLRTQGRKIIVGKTFVLTLVNNTQIRFGPIDDLGKKARAAVAVLQAEKGHPLLYVDVRSPRVPVSRARPSPTPTPSPGATGAPSTPAPSPASPPPPTSPAPAASPATLR